MSLSVSRYICEVKLHASHKRVNIKVYAGLFRLQVKYELYQAFGESPKTRIRCSAEVSMAFDRYTTRRTGTICQPEMQVKNGSIASSLSGISLGHYIV